MSKLNDRALRFYNEVLGLDRLHYGIWLPDDQLSIEKLKEAQERYENYLVDSIPEGVESILDVGCGTGVLVKKLIDLSYQVEGLSPDINQKQIFIKDHDLGESFHHSTFEDFSIANKYDCIIMSESCQYINPDKVFDNARHSLKNNGHLMICDYFVLNDATGDFSKSGHNYEAFMKLVESKGFTIVTEKDITKSVTKTLDIGKDFYEKAMKGLDIGTEKIRNKHPTMSKFILWLFKNKIEKATKQLELLDSEKFEKYKTYRFILLQATNSSTPNN